MPSQSAYFNIKRGKKQGRSAQKCRGKRVVICREGGGGPPPCASEPPKLLQGVAEDGGRKVNLPQLQKLFQRQAVGGGEKRVLHPFAEAALKDRPGPGVREQLLSLFNLVILSHPFPLRKLSRGMSPFPFPDTTRSGAHRMEER